MEDMKNLRDDLVRVIAAQARRYDLAAGRLDSSGFESYGKLCARMDKLSAAVKPLDKTLKEYWKQVSGGDEQLQASYLHELESEAMSAAAELICFAATVSRAIWAADPWQDRMIGQMSFDDLVDEDMPPEDYDPTIDEATGEIVEEDLPAAEEVIGSDE